MTFGSRMSYSSSNTRVSALEKLKQSNAAKLELETRKMEERIRALKEKMMKEKEERERQGGTRWASGKPGGLTTSNQKPKKTSPKEKVTKGPRRIKILSDEPLNHYIRKPKPDVSSKINATNRCGQCERSSSVWVCRECSENYCDECFNQFHQKGALKRHTKVKFEEGNIAKTKDDETLTNSVKSIGQKSPVRSFGETTNSNFQSPTNGQSLLNGSYDEKESAASFAKALQEWRQQGQLPNNTPRTQVTCTDTSCGTSNQFVDVVSEKKEIQITFHNSMSYGDRLYLKKGRQDPAMLVRQLPGTTDVPNTNYETETRKELDNNHTREKPTNQDEKMDSLSPNYREMIQKLATTTKVPEETAEMNHQGSYYPPENNISITEVSANEWDDNSHSTATCVVEEYVDNSEEEKGRPTNCRHGRLSIQEMLPTGDFSNQPSLDKDSALLQSPRYVSPSLTTKPFSLKLTAGRKKQPQPPKSAPRKSSSKKRMVHVLHNKPDEQVKKTSEVPVFHAWRPRPTHKDMSEFFLAGVKPDNENGKSTPNKDDDEEMFTRTEYILSKGNLPTTWQPHCSYLPAEAPKTPEAEHENVPITSARTARSPENDTTAAAANSITANTTMEEFPIAALRGSDEDEDLPTVLGMDDFGTGDQDEDDRATLNELDWELASSTGRLTRCEADILDLESDDDDSIEDKDGGSGLTTPRTLEGSPSLYESMMDDFEEMERKCMEEEF